MATAKPAPGATSPAILSSNFSAGEDQHSPTLPGLLQWPNNHLQPQVVLDRLLKLKEPHITTATNLTNSWLDSHLHQVQQRGPIVEMMASRLGLGTGSTTTLGRRLVAAIIFSPAFSAGLIALQQRLPEAQQLWQASLQQLIPAFSTLGDPSIPRSHPFPELWDTTVHLEPSLPSAPSPPAAAAIPHHSRASSLGSI